MFFEYLPGFENSDFLGQLRAERAVADELGMELRCKFLRNVENLLQHFHQDGDPTRLLKPSSNHQPSELIKMRMKNEALKVLHSLGGRLEDDSLTESHVHEEQANAHSKTTKQSTSSNPQKAYRYSCPVRDITI